MSYAITMTSLSLLWRRRREAAASLRRAWRLVADARGPLGLGSALVSSIIGTPPATLAAAYILFMAVGLAIGIGSLLVSQLYHIYSGTTYVSLLKHQRHVQAARQGQHGQHGHGQGRGAGTGQPTLGGAWDPYPGASMTTRARVMVGNVWRVLGHGGLWPQWGPAQGVLLDAGAVEKKRS